MILDCGSVKLRCAAGFGLNGWRPMGGRRRISSPARRAVSVSRASRSSASFACRLFANRLLRR